jgi:hypothetical protein
LKSLRKKASEQVDPIQGKRKKSRKTRS